MFNRKIFPTIFWEIFQVFRPELFLQFFRNYFRSLSWTMIPLLLCKSFPTSFQSSSRTSLGSSSRNAIRNLSGNSFLENLKLFLLEFLPLFLCEFFSECFQKFFVQFISTFLTKDPLEITSEVPCARNFSGNSSHSSSKNSFRRSFDTRCEIPFRVSPRKGNFSRVCPKRLY